MIYLVLFLSIPAGIYLFLFCLYINDMIWERKNKRVL